MPVAAINCANCGAPLHETVSRRRLVCHFCGSCRPISDLEFSDERLISLGHATGVDCPGCRTPLVSAIADDQRVEFCPSCRGVLFSGEAFQHVVRQRRGEYRGNDAAPVPLDPADLQHRRDCPRCERHMDVHPYYGPGNTVIDSCFPCRLVWLDHGEITHIERAPGRR